jgi:hypothetical protein
LDEDRGMAHPEHRKSCIGPNGIRDANRRRIRSTECDAHIAQGDARKRAITARQRESE